MFARIVQWSLDNRVVVVCAWLLVAAVGLRSMTQLPIDAVPDVTNVQVQVLTNVPGLAPEEVETFVTFPVETAMSGVPKVEQVRSVSKFGLSVVTVVFEEGSDIYWARQQVSERLVVAKEQIPEGYGDPEMGPISTGLGEIFQFEVRGEPACPEGGPDTEACWSPMELRTLLDWTVATRLRAVPGIVEVNSFGGEWKAWQVTLDPDALVAQGLSVGDVTEALDANNRNVGGGTLARGGEQYLVRGEGLIRSLDDLGDVVLSRDESGTPVRVRDVARVEFAPVIRQGAVTRDGRGEAVVGIVMMLMGADSRTVVRDVKEALEQVTQTLPEGVSIDPFYDRTELIQRTIATVRTNLLEGGFLVIVVLLLFLGNLRGGLIVASAIPLSMLVAFVGMRALGLSGNLMSLGAIDFGLIVDGAVVMIENIVRVLHEEKPRDAVTRRAVVRRAASEVARPVTFAVSIITLVYLPVLALTGIEGKMFGPMALTVVSALVGSLVCALTLMPVLASYFLTRPTESEPKLFVLARALWRRVFDLTGRRPRLTFTAAVALFLSSLGLIPWLGAEFIPTLDEGAIAMQIWRLPSVSLEESNRIATRAEQVIKAEFPEVDTVISRTGRAEIATDPMGVEISDTYLMLNEPETWRFDTKDELVAAIDAELKRSVPGAMFSYSQPIELRVSELIAGVRSAIGIQVYGDDLIELKRVADEVAAVVSTVPGAAEVKAEQTIGLPLQRVIIDRQAVARHGLNADDVLDVVQAIGGIRAGTIVEGQQRFPLLVRYDEGVRDDPERIADLRVALPEVGGQRAMVPLGQLAEIRIEDGPAQISREAISRRINVETNVRGRDLASFVAEARARVDQEVELPPGWRVHWGGQFENLEAAAARLAVLVPLALILIFVLLYQAFGSVKLAILIFLNVPLATTGGLFALALRGYPLSISAGVGFIALFGIAVLNGVVLVSYAVARRDAGASPSAAAEQAAEIRLRAVLMTALTDILGFVPMALATSAGAEVQRPLATVVIGGLLTCTMLTLLVLPVVYPWFDRASPGDEPEPESK